MTITLTKAPFRADHVGSLLRSETIRQARKQWEAGAITAEQRYAVETKEIERIVTKQIEVGLRLVTDGELRRRMFHIDFLEHLNGLEGYVPERGLQFSGGVESERYNVRNTGKISFNIDHPFLKEFEQFNRIVNGRAVAKQTIPGVASLLVPGIRNKAIYPDIEEYVADVVQTFREAIAALYDAGLRYLQLDDPFILGLALPNSAHNDESYSKEYLTDLAARATNDILKSKPEDLVVTLHLCRGNYQSAWLYEGGYDSIARTLFTNEKIDGFFLEFDDERSGTFQPLKHVSPQAKVVLGVVTSKTGELEDREKIKARIEEATQYVPLEQLCLSPQCGFASTHHGNKLTEEQQWEKLKLIVDIANELWRDA